MTVDTNEIERLVDMYIDNPNIENRNNVLIACTPIVKVIVQKIAKSLGYSFLPEDLEAYAYMGVIDALNRYDKAKEIKFTTYFPNRAVGSIRDEMRKISSVPRSLLDFFSKIDKINERLNRDASNEELAKELKISEERVKKILSIRERSRLEYLNSYLNDSEEEKTSVFLQDDSNIPERIFFRKEYANEVRDALSILTPKERIVIDGMYYKNKLTAVIAKEMGITEPRVSQLHTSALKRLKEKLIESVDCNLFFLN